MPDPSHPRQAPTEPAPHSMRGSGGALTRLLIRAGSGNEDAQSELWRFVYPELRKIAHAELRRRRPGQTLQTTSLVHEAYLRLFDPAQTGWNDRVHFYATAAKAMRQILIDHARRIASQKRGGEQVRLQLDESFPAAEERAETFLLLDRSLSRLSELNSRMGSVVECRFFGGMTHKEIAEWLDVTERTVERDWRKAKAFLTAALSEPGNHAYHG